MLWMQFLGRVRSQAWLRIVWLSPIGCVVDCCWVTLYAEGKERKCQMQNDRGYVGLGIFYCFSFKRVLDMILARTSRHR